MNKKNFTILGIFLLFFTTTLVASDSTVYLFSDQQPPTRSRTALIAFVEVLNNIEKIYESKQLQNKTDFPEGEYLVLKQNLEQILSQNTDDPIFSYAKRRIIVLDWLAGKKNTTQTVAELNALSDEFKENDEVRNLNLAFAATILARDSYINEARLTFEKIEPSKTHCYPFYAFEIVKYFADDIEQNQPDHNSPKAGKFDAQDYQRRANFTDFLEDVYIPQMLGYIESENSKQILNVMNTQMGLDVTCKKAVRELTETKYLDLTERLANEILPQLIEIWRESVMKTGNILSEDQIIQNMNKIEECENTILPTTRKIVKDIQFGREFSSHLGELSYLIEMEIAETTSEVNEKINIKQEINSKIEKLKSMISTETKSKAIFLPSLSYAIDNQIPFIYDIESNDFLRPNYEVTMENIAETLGHEDYCMWDNGIVVSDSKKVTFLQEEKSFEKNAYGELFSVSHKDLPCRFNYHMDNTYTVTIHEITEIGIIITSTLLTQ